MNELIKSKLSTISTSAGVYIMKDINEKVIYVGKARNLKNRVSTYFNNAKKHIKVQAMVNSVHDFDYIVCKSEYDALALENNLIKKYQPYYNILLKDGKTFPYIKLDYNKNFPYFEITRKVINDGSKYFGPYIGKFRAKDIVSILNSAFSLRECHQNIQNDKKCKSCLRKDIGQCLAPCINNDIKKEYDAQLKKAIKYLNGDDEVLLSELEYKMQQMVENENYEKAIVYRDNIKMLQNVHEKVITELPKSANIDAIAYSSNANNTAITLVIIRNGKLIGIETNIVESIEENVFESYILQYYQDNALPKEILLINEISEDAVNYLCDLHNKKSAFISPKKGIKKQIIDMAKKNAEQVFIKEMNKQELEYSRTLGAVYNLQNILHLSKPPLRMECYDISHISGVYKVASMVVFIDGKPAKAHYRKFKIKEVEGNNDFESLKETLKRRLNELNDSENKDISFSSVPDLLVIDGGKGQLSSVMEIFDNYAGKYKQEINVISLAKREEEVFVPNKSEPIIIGKNKMELQLLQRIRDEAHRFAITFHRSLRGKGMVKSFLDDIKGIGPKKKKLLFKEFSNIEDLEKARIEDLMKVQGITEKLAKDIYDRLH